MFLTFMGNEDKEKTNCMRPVTGLGQEDVEQMLLNGEDAQASPWPFLFS